MLDSLYIKNFRLFKKLIVKKLERVNLIVGKNNVGKTGLLEALLIYANNASPHLLEALISERCENWDIENRNQLQPADNPLRHLFHERYFPLDEGIEIGSFIHPSNRIHLRTRYYQTVVNKKGEHHSVPIDEPHRDDLADLLMVLEFQEGSNGKPLPLSYLSIGDSQKHLNTPKAKLAVEFVSANRHKSDKLLAQLWNNIRLTDLKTEVITLLQIIEPSIQDLELTISNDKNIFIIARLKDSKERVPLDTFGEGMISLFNLTLALVNSSNGFLLIDEFEKGLHYTVQIKVWEIVFKLAKELNIQVFATTHSGDCVTAFQAVSENLEEEATLFRLGRNVFKNDDRKVIVIEYDKEELSRHTKVF